MSTDRKLQIGTFLAEFKLRRAKSARFDKMKQLLLVRGCSSLYTSCDRGKTGGGAEKAHHT